MSDSPGAGGKFAADIYELYDVARTDMRELADKYSDLSGQVGETSGDNIDPPPPTGNVARGQSALRSGALLSSLRDDLQYAYARSSENVEAAANTLLAVAESYAATDEETQSEFDALQTENHPDGTPPMLGISPPAYPGSTGGHGQPRPRD
jgi:hypothetical protein